MPSIRKGAAVLLGLAALLIFSATAEAQTFGQNKVQYRRYDWRSISSDHFEVYFYTGLDSVAMRVLDLAEKTHVYLSAHMGHSLTRRVPIVLFGSHHDFAQTNITPELIDGSTGGFTEALRNRVVLPFTGSYEDLRHVVVHELVHAVMFDLLYEGNAASMIARQSFYTPPLWFAEGMAEYYSLGVESNAQMILRDGTIEGYLPPLAWASGYIVYKQGQSAVDYLVRRYGEDRLRDLLQRIRAMGNFDRAFQRSIGMTPENFDRQWRDWLKEAYWPTVTDKQGPDKFARRLTDHRHDTSNLNTAPAVSPQGDRIAYFSDRRQYTDVYVMSALDGRVLRRLIRGERNTKFEGIPSFRSSLTWSPDGERVALTAKSGGRDVLYVVWAANGHVEREVQLPCESLYYPSWSPVSDSIVVVGVREGRSDLWLVRANHPKNEPPIRLTDDTYDEKEPAWSPDGTSLVFASDRHTPVVLYPQRQERGFGSYGLYTMDLATRHIAPIVDTYGDDHCPVWSPDGKKLLFISDRNGTPNAYVYDTTDSLVVQLTDVIGGIQSLSTSRENNRIVFSAFNTGGFDVFIVRENIVVPGVLARLKRQHPEAVFTLKQIQQSGEHPMLRGAQDAALAAAWPDSLAETPGPASAARADSAALTAGAAVKDSAAAATGALAAAPDSARTATHAAVAATDSTGSAANAVPGAPDSTASATNAVPAAPDSTASATNAVPAAPDSAGVAAGALAAGGVATPATTSAPPVLVPPPVPGDSVAASAKHHEEPPAWAGGPPTTRPQGALASPPPPLKSTPLADTGGPFALPDSVLGQTPTPYRVKMAADYASGGIYAAGGYGFVGATQFLFSDFLGNHELMVTTDVFVSSLKDLNAFVLYNYLPRRWDYGVGLFHFTNYFSTRVSTIGEDFRGVKTFSERSYGVTGTAAYPFDRFRRVEFAMTQTFLDRTFYQPDAFGDYYQIGNEKRSLTSPSVSLVGDNTLFGFYGPVNGARYNLTYAPSFAVFDNGLAYQTIVLDARRYWDLTRGYTFAGRIMTGVSDGPDPQTFRVGGYSTLRGYPDFDMLGSRVVIVNSELRFPFIQQLGIVGPVPVGLFNMRGALFTDIGMVWDKGDPLRFTNVVAGQRGLESPKMGFGTGIRAAPLYMLMKLDVAWATDFRNTSAPRWHFSIGSEF